MTSSEEARFTAVSPSWQYQIKTPSVIIQFDPQPGERWLAHTGGKEFRLLTPPVAVAMLNEALDLGLSVIATQPTTKQTLLFQRPNVSTPARTPTTEHA